MANGHDSASPIGLYELRPVSYAPYDRQAPVVAANVAALIGAVLPDAQVEHIGSTAVHGCAGKGIVDLMVLYPPGTLAETRNALDGLGFQRQGGPNPFPESRPMRVGSYLHQGKVFRLHVHVLELDTDEARAICAFRDRLRADTAVVSAYAAAKRAILHAGATDPVTYTRRKSEFVEALLAQPAIHSRGAAPAIAPASPPVTEVAG